MSRIVVGKWGIVVALAFLCASASSVAAQDLAGALRGVVYDDDFDAPLPLARIEVLELGTDTTTTEAGSYVFQDLAPGRYTLVFSKEGYVRQLRSDVVVTAGQLTEVDVRLTGDFTEMAEFVVQVLASLGAGTEAALLKLRFEGPSLLDSISADLMSRAGASDAASALTLVSGASVEDGKFAVIRGLPDRFVSSQINGARLPTSDEDKRAVELDQFPSAVIESIQVTKTFTPDQQGDASGGAVDVRLRGVPAEPVSQLKVSTSYNTQSTGRSDFLSYDGGGVGLFGEAGTEKDIQFDNIGGNWTGAVGVRPEDAPFDFKVSGAFGDRHELDSGLVVGGFASVFYERDSSHSPDGIDDSYWLDDVDSGVLTPEVNQQHAEDDFLTSLFDVTRSSQAVQWGGLGTLGLESEHHQLGLTFLYTHIAEDKATLAEDTRGKEYFFPGYDPDDPDDPGNASPNLAPYIRTETLEYSERDTSLLQLRGKHTFETESHELAGLDFQDAILDWRAAVSFARLDQPDKRQFGAIWLPGYEDPGNPAFGIPPKTVPPEWSQLKPSANINLGNLQRTFKDIREDSTQGGVDLKLPFQRLDEQEGYLKFGAYADHLTREFRQESFTNPDFATFPGDFDDSWSAAFPGEDHAIQESLFDVDYDGELNVKAFYAMADVPLSPTLNLIGGARIEETEIKVVNTPDPGGQATWLMPDSITPSSDFEAANVDFNQRDVLPSIGLVYEPNDKVTVRASYSETIARQTFKELTPILQSEFLGGPTFIGNPELRMASLENLDLRVDYRPHEGGLISVSAFHKDVTDAIEYVQRLVSFNFTTPLNYPKGRLTGYEVEVREDLGQYWESAHGISLGANATFIDSEVTLTDGEIADFEDLGTPFTTRDMTFAPEHLYNLYVTYDIERTGTQLAAFYTVKGDTLVAGATESSGNFVPSVYATEYGTLNLSLSQPLGKHSSLKIGAKNLLDPSINEVFRSPFQDGDVVNTSYRRGREFTIGLTLDF